MGISGASFRRIGRLADDVSVFGVPFRTPDVEEADGTELFGTRVLRHFVLTFDQRGDRVRVRRLGEGPVEPEPVEGTGVLVVPHEDGLRVVGLTPDSPASRAGLAEGELVLEIGGVPALQPAEDGFPESLEGDRRFLRYLLEGPQGRRTVDLDVVPLVPLPTPQGASGAVSAPAESGA